VPKLGKRGCGQSDLGQRRQSFIDEPLQPPQRGTLVLLGVGGGKEFAH
jgi:hypothetical protein